MLLDDSGGCAREKNGRRDERSDLNRTFATRRYLTSTRACQAARERQVTSGDVMKPTEDFVAIVVTLDCERKSLPAKYARVFPWLGRPPSAEDLMRAAWRGRVCVSRLVNLCKLQQKPCATPLGQYGSA